MTEVKTDRHYTETHEWVIQEDAGVICVGITDHAQELMGDMVFVELPEVGTVFATGDDVCVVESVKAASDVYAPVSGTIVEVNENLSSAPEQVNSGPYDNGWLFKIKLITSFPT